MSNMTNRNMIEAAVGRHQQEEFHNDLINIPPQ